MTHDTPITRRINLAELPVVREAPSLDIKISRGRKPHSAEMIHSDCPCPRRNAGAGEDTNFVGADDSVDIEEAVCSACRSGAGTGHVEVVVLIDLPFADGPVSSAGGAVRGCACVGLAQKVCEEVVEGEAAQPVAAKADGVVAFEPRDPPSCTCGDLFWAGAVLVDVDLSLRETTGSKHAVERRDIGLEVVDWI